MKVLIQRVKEASCRVNNKITGKINKGYLILVGFTNGDDLNSINKAVKKIVNLRIFNDEFDKMNLNIKQVEGKILSISQFTLYANTENGNRPSFTEALAPNEAKMMYEKFNQLLSEAGIEVEVGIFGAHMEISLINDGPVTLNLEF